MIDHQPRVTDSPNTAGEPRQLRIQTAMVVYELEQALGRYVLTNETDPSSLPAETIEHITQRENSKGRKIDTDKVTSIVEATYLDEVFGLALHVAGASQEREILSDLKELCAALDIYAIRNAVSHPNRQFPECYWYRVATIATDPLIQQLRLYSVISTFRAAESGQLQAPPEEWIDRVQWSIPNNLPNTFDHSITGLIGRKRELRRVASALRNPKAPLIAIVAPGGRGKTALLLEVLHQLSLEPESAEWIDEIYHISFKTQMLSHEGIQEIESGAETTIAGLQLAIAREMSRRHHESISMSFEDAKLEHENTRLLLSLDNLETLLRESPSDFRDFYLSLPASWRVIVTSRISLEMAMTIKLDALDHNGAIALAQSYLSRRGQKIASDTALESLVERSENNPLAIRLTIDSYVAGKSLHEAVDEVYEEILKFSFMNLIDTLSKDSIAILECLFALGEPATRAELCSLLDLNRDQVAESLEELMRTSLVSRFTTANEERTALSSSVRDLLLLNPVDPQLRSDVVDRVTRQKTLLSSQIVEQRLQEKTPLDEDYIPEGAPDHSKELSIRVYRTLRKRNRIEASRLLPEVQRTVEANPTEPLIHRVLGHLLIFLGDEAKGKTYLFDAAVKLQPRDPAAAYDLANRLLSSQDLEDAYDLADWLVGEGWADGQRSDLEHARNILRVRWLSLMWQGNIDTVIEETQDWYASTDFATTMGGMHASALRRSVEREDPEVAQTALKKAISTISTLFEMEGVTGVSANEGLKLIDDIYTSVQKWSVLPPELAFAACAFVDSYLLAMVDVHRDYSQDDRILVQWIRTFSECDCGDKANPLHRDIWLRFLEEGIYVEDSDFEYISKGYEIVRIYYRPAQSQYYLFARNDEGEQFYVDRESFDGNDIVWHKLGIDDRLAIVRKNVLDREKAIPALVARLIR